MLYKLSRLVSRHFKAKCTGTSSQNNTYVTWRLQYRLDHDWIRDTRTKYGILKWKSPGKNHTED
jgi:hypothetical protein